MHHVCIILLTVIANYSLASYTYQAEAIVRGKKFKAKNKQVVLVDLLSKTHFIGKNFKIVSGVSDKAIKLETSDKKLKLKAATVYYHLVKAKKFFDSRIAFVRKMPQIIIRLDITREFHGDFHFKNKNLLMYNNALSVPAGLGSVKRNIKQWQKEIWFRPSKKIHLDELISKGQVQNNASNSAILKAFRSQAEIINWQRFLSRSISESNKFKNGAYFKSQQFVNSFMRTAGTTILMELLFKNMDKINKFFSRKHYWMETALIPEIIYHEYAHIALSDYLNLDLSKPVIEGMADYFATRIADSSQIAHKIKKYSTFKPKNAKNKTHYQLLFEGNNYANSDFVLSILWQFKESIGATKADEFILNSRKLLDGQSNIKDEFTAALSTSIRENGSLKDLLVFKEILFEKGL